MRNHARECNFARGALARFDIRGIDARGGQSDAHFTGTGMRRLNFADPQYLARGAIAFIESGLHEPYTLGIHDNMTGQSANRAKNRNRGRALSVITSTFRGNGSTSRGPIMQHRVYSGSKGSADVSPL